MSLNRFPPRMQLAAEPAIWKVTLNSGETLSVLTHGYAVEGDEYVFTLLMEGEPCFEVEVLRIPSHLVAGTEG